jgi:hypothetical protein
MKSADHEALLDVINSEMDDSMSFSNIATSSAKGQDIENPLDYYLGNPLGNEVEGRSQVISTDVADAIEWIMPQVMKAIVSSYDVVTFDPLNEGDEDQAELETSYVFDVIMKDNPGFIALHTFVKDALLQRVGLIKTFYERRERKKTRSFTGISEEQLAFLATIPNVEPANMTSRSVVGPDMQPTTVFDVTVKEHSSEGRVVIQPVPIEHFRIASRHTSVDLTDCPFCAHSEPKTLSYLREQGFDEELLKDLPRVDLLAGDYRFIKQKETIMPVTQGGDINSPEQVTLYTEIYMFLDIDKDGISEYVKINCVGDTDRVTKILSIEELDMCPWVATNAILMSHKFVGLSIYDRLKQIQEQKTALVRNILDNIYFVNNRIKTVIEALCDMDDVLTSKPGGIIRVKNQDAVRALDLQPLDPNTIEILRYLDSVSAGRSGVSAEGATAPQNIGDRVGSQGVADLMTAKEELVGLIIRVIAETGLKPLYMKIRDLAYMHTDTIVDYKFRGRWLQTNPMTWPARSHSTVRVGTGAGDRSFKMAIIKDMQLLQTQLATSPAAYMVSPTKVYKTADDYCKFGGLVSASRYLVDPDSEEGMTAKQAMDQAAAADKEKQEAMAMAEIQMQQQIAQAELGKAQAMQTGVILKNQIEELKHSRELEKQTMQAEIETLKFQLDKAKEMANAAQKDVELDFKYDQLDAELAKHFATLNNQKDLAEFNASTQVELKKLEAENAKLSKPSNETV